MLRLQRCIVAVMLLLGSTSIWAQGTPQFIRQSSLNLADSGIIGEGAEKKSSDPVHDATLITEDLHSTSLPEVRPAIHLIRPVKPEVSKTHPFFDKKNSLLIGVSALTLSLDGLSTQRFLANPNCYEVNPIARPFVRSRFGSAAYFGTSLAGEIGAMRLAHKRNHHLVEHLIPLMVISSEAFMAYHNYGLSQR